MWIRAEIITQMDSACENKLVITATMRCIPMFFFFVITVSSCAIQNQTLPTIINHYLGSLRGGLCFLELVSKILAFILKCSNLLPDMWNRISPEEKEQDIRALWFHREEQYHDLLTAFCLTWSTQLAHMYFFQVRCYLWYFIKVGDPSPPFLMVSTC